MATAKPWNPMEDAYKNQNFNKYSHGPGAELDDNLQPGAIAAGGAPEKRPDRFQLCLKNVPSDMTDKGLWNLCGNYGKVTGVRRTAKTPYVFVGFATVNDLERALERFRDEHPQGIDADIAKHTASNLVGESGPGKFPGGGEVRWADKDRNSDSGSSSQIDMSRRTIKGPFANPPRIKIERKPFVTEEDYLTTDLNVTDPDRNFLIDHDMYDSERNNRQKFEEDDEGGRKMYTGRAYYIEPKESIERQKKMSAASKGYYNAEKDEFIKSAPQFDHILAQIQYCSLCKGVADKICQRCGDYYCSLDCQKKDWNRHRLFCFPMPELVAPVTPTSSPLPSSSGPRTDANSSSHSLNDSFENKFQGKGGQQKFDGKKSQDQQRTFDNKRGPQDYNDKNDKNRNDNRQQNSRFSGSGGGSGGTSYNDSNKQERNTQGFNDKTNRNRSDDSRPQNHRFGSGSGVGSSYNDSNNQENRKNFMNQNSNRSPRDKDRENTSSFENRKEFDQKKDAGNRTTSPTKTSPRNVETRNLPEPPKQEAIAKDEKISGVPDKPIQIIRAEYPKSGSIVAITAVIRPNKVYIRSMDSEDNVDYIKTINIISSEGKKAKPLEKMPEKSALAITDFQGEGYYRVLVLNPESKDKILVAYIDFGNVDFRKLSDLKEITPELISLKRHALVLTLKGVEDFEPTDKVKEYMQAYVDSVGRDLKLVYDKKPEKGPLEAELIDVSTNDNLSAVINRLRVVKPPLLNELPVFSNEIEFKIFPVGKNVPLIVLDTSLVQTGAISCIQEKDLIEIEKMTQLFADYVKSTTGPYTPRPQEICLVQYDDDCWYRAECIEVVGDQHPSVMFIDFGNLTTAHIDKIRKYPRELVMPCVTVTCLLLDIPEIISDPLANRLKELIPANDKIIVDTVEVVDDQTNGIRLHEVAQMLRNENLLD